MSLIEKPMTPHWSQHPLALTSPPPSLLAATPLAPLLLPLNSPSSLCSALLQGSHVPPSISNSLPRCPVQVQLTCLTGSPPLACRPLTPPEPWSPFQTLYTLLFTSCVLVITLHKGEAFSACLFLNISAAPRLVSGTWQVLCMYLLNEWIIQQICVEGKDYTKWSTPKQLLTDLKNLDFKKESYQDQVKEENSLWGRWGGGTRGQTRPALAVAPPSCQTTVGSACGTLKQKEPNASTI